MITFKPPNSNFQSELLLAAFEWISVSSFFKNGINHFHGFFVDYKTAHFRHYHPSNPHSHSPLTFNQRMKPRVSTIWLVIRPLYLLNSLTKSP